ncbi:MAG: hypothetical protein CGW95_16295 [Phenylobacterium zucineum]|nr:MAG: hypothetical protein CGW95_16295 [Phenylobacterium zucineum]
MNSTTSGRLIGLLRLVASIAAFGTIYWQVSDRITHDLFRAGEYWLYFSIDTTVLAGIVLGWSAISTLRGRPESRVLTLARLTLVATDSIVGIVYNLLLRGGAPDARDVGYDWPVVPNELMHVWIPVFVVLDFLFVSYGGQLKIQAATWMLVYPLSWLGMTMAHGLASGWWPYWFLDPTGDGGWATVGEYIGIIIVLGVGLAAGMLALSRSTAKLKTL